MRHFKSLSEMKDFFSQWDCDQLSKYLSAEWGNIRDVDQDILIEIMLTKNCPLGQVLPFLFKLMEDTDPYYRYMAMNYIVELDGIHQRNFLIQVFLNDPDQGNRNRALILLTDVFRNQRDKGILRLALSSYDDPSSNVATRLAAGAAMMYQLDISHDEDGRPAWWDEANVEELQHLAILQAVESTRELLRTDSSS